MADHFAIRGTYGNGANLNLTFAMFMLGRNGMPGQPTDFFSWSTTFSAGRPLFQLVDHFFSWITG